MGELKIHLQYFGTCQINNEIFFSNVGFNGFFSLDTNNYELKTKKVIPFIDEKSFVPYAYSTDVYEDYLIFYPNNCDKILIYNIKTMEFKNLQIMPEDKKDIYISLGTARHNGKVWIFPQQLSQGIFVLNLDTFKLERDIELSKSLSRFKKLSWLIRLTDTKIVVLSDNKIVEIDIITKIIKKINNLEKILDVYSIRYDGENYWILLSNSTDIYEWNPETDQYNKFQLMNKDKVWITQEGIPYNNIIFYKEEIIILPYRLNYIMRIDRENRTIKRAINYPKGFRFLKNKFSGWIAFSAFDIIGNKLFLHPALGNMLLIYNIEKNYIEGKELTITTKDFPFLPHIIEQEILRINGRYYDGYEDLGNLNGFIRMPVNENNKERKEKLSGNRIYSFLKNNAL